MRLVWLTKFTVQNQSRVGALSWLSAATITVLDPSQTPAASQ